MGLPQMVSWLPLWVTWVLFLLCLRVHGDGIAGNGVRILKGPPAFSSSTSAEFGYEVVGGRNGVGCRNCNIQCKLDDIPITCEGGEVSHTDLVDGDHRFEVCINGLQGIDCASYNWTVDTVPPTAYVSAASAFTNALNVSVNISFSEPCPGGGGFQCSMSDCNLLVYGAGYVIPSTLKVLQPDLKYSLSVAISSDVQYGRLVLVMDRGFCTDISGNRFTRTENSRYFLHFDRRSVSVIVSTRVPEKLLQINNVMRTVEATNNNKNLRIYLHFSEPVLNSSAQILRSLHTSTGTLLPTNRSNLGNRRFGFLVGDIASVAIVTISLETNLIISRQGTPVSPIKPITFLYDVERPSVLLSAPTLRTREHTASLFVKFVKPVFDFSPSAIVISGGRLLGYHNASRSMYTVEVQFVDSTVSIKVPENIAGDVAGNKNLASNLLQVQHYSTPTISYILSMVISVAFVVTTFLATLLTVSTATLLSFGALTRASSYFASEPSRNIMRIVYHLQAFAQSKWLAVTLPIEFYEFARGIQWSIPYLSLPWESGSMHSSLKDPSSSVGTFYEASKLQNDQFSPPENGEYKIDAPAVGSPLSPMEYMTFFENQNMKPEAEFIQMPQSSDRFLGCRWKYFGRHMFWLAVIGGGLMLLHALILFILRFRKKNSENNKGFGALVFPRFEIFLIFLAFPCICQAAATVVKGQSTGGMVVGIILLGFTAIFLVCLLLFISIGITMGKLLQYKEVHQEGQKLHWYQGIVRASLGPGKRGQWTWKDRPNSIHVTRLGPLFEDLRGPPKYMLSQIAAKGTTGKRTDKIIASDDETEDAEAPFIQKLFGILRIYYTFLESIKRVSLGIVAGAYSSNRSSRTPILVVLSTTAFQLFFLALKKPFIKKKLQLVEIISLAGEVGIFATCLVLWEKDLSEAEQRKVGIFMLSLFMIGFLMQMVNEWYALYRQVIRLSPDEDSFVWGLKTAVLGLLLIFIPPHLLSGLDDRLSSDRGEGESRSSLSPGGRKERNSGGNERSWIRQLREIAKDSFSRDDGRHSTDPSTSRNRRTGSSSVSSLSDSKQKPKALLKDLEAIFSSK